jgi:hypothetical protein
MSWAVPQLPLFPWPAFEPVPPAQLHYVPILLDWPGELRALADTPDTRLARMTPLIQIAPSATKTMELGRWVRDRVNKVAEAVGLRTIFLDLLVPPRSVGALFPMVLGEARRSGLTFVPVHTVGGRSLDAAAASAIQDGRGVALRYHADTSVSMGGRLQDILGSECERLGVSPADADLIIDLGWIRPGSELTAPDLTGYLDDALAPGPWRNVIVGGTSVPKSLTEVGIREGLLGYIPRSEWRLWRDLHQSRPDRILFADYGIQSPRTPIKDKSGFMRANLRYTTPEWILAVRGTGAFNQLPREARVEQYQGLCRRVMEDPLFVGRSCCVGDLTVERCSDGLIGPTSQTVWRGVGATHHFAAVVGQLLAIEAQEAPAPPITRPIEVTTRASSRRGAVRRPEPSVPLRGRQPRPTR